MERYFVTQSVGHVRPVYLSRGSFGFKQETLAAGPSQLKHLISWQQLLVFFTPSKRNYFLVQPESYGKKGFSCTMWHSII